MIWVPWHQARTGLFNLVWWVAPAPSLKRLLYHSHQLQWCTDEHCMYILHTYITPYTSTSTSCIYIHTLCIQAWYTFMGGCTTCTTHQLPYSYLSNLCTYLLGISIVNWIAWAQCLVCVMTTSAFQLNYTAQLDCFIVWSLWILSYIITKQYNRKKITKYIIQKVVSLLTRALLEGAIFPPPLSFSCDIF